MELNLGRRVEATGMSLQPDRDIGEAGRGRPLRGGRNCETGRPFVTNMPGFELEFDHFGLATRSPDGEVARRAVTPRSAIPFGDKNSSFHRAKRLRAIEIIETAEADI
jgi:hypothetical protein